jgi:tricorn protease-like protein
VEIELDGIAARIQEVAVPSGNYSNLAVAGKRICWLDHNAQEPQKNALQCLDIANKGDKPDTLMEGATDFEVSADGKKILIRKQNDLLIVDAAAKGTALKDPKTLADSQVDLKNWTFSVIPSDEFREGFLDAWRLHRDYFYDRNMHGVNWTAMVRPERRVVLAGASPVRVSAGAPGSRLQPVGEIRPSRAECRKPLKERGANRRAATISERNSLVILSAERCLGGPSRSCHGEGNRQHPGSERMLDLPGVAGGGTQG